ncbi:PTS transporter subunit EIIC [Arcanobacterium haemolyticum]|nr:PTS transporter subunit EIIC [Arcanobacterium haemolyticum]
MMEKLQRFGKALMGAVAVMPVAALLMGIGYWIDPDGWGSGNIAAMILIKSGAAVLDNLGYIFAMAIAFGLAKDSNGAAALSGFLSFQSLLFLLGEKTVAVFKGVDLEALGELDKQSDEVLAWVSQGWGAVGPKNVLFGIAAGLLAAWCYNKFHATKLPDFLAFFSGRRSVPIITAVLSLLLALILFFVWPVLYGALFHFGQWIIGLGAGGAAVYGFFNRLLIPTGLHHALNSIFWFDVVGINDIGKFYGGKATIEAAEAATDAATCPGLWSDGACQVVGFVGRYQAGFFPIMMFGLAGAALAIYLTADKSKRKVIGSLMGAGALASFFTGVTEPLEFSFMFVAPLLYVVHAALTAVSMFLAAAMEWTAGFSFSAGLVDLVLSARNPLANKWYMLVVVGLVFFLVYFGVFYGLIKLFNLKTPGREDDPADDEGVDFGGDANFSSIGMQILDGLGGPENIDSLDHCTTRLRVTVKDPTKVSESRIKKTGVPGVIRPSQKAVQVIVGPQVQFVFDEVAAQVR